MCYTGLLKRIVPFALTFAVGLFLASFFVSLALPGEAWRTERRINKANELRQLRMDFQRLEERYREVRQENEELKKKSRDWDSDDLMDEVPPVGFEAHHPPPPRRDPRGSGYGNENGLI